MIKETLQFTAIAFIGVLFIGSTFGDSAESNAQTVTATATSDVKATAVASSAVATLEVIPRKTLPGIPVIFVVTLTTRSGVPIAELSRAGVIFDVTPVGGQTFRADPDQFWKSLHVDAGGVIAIPRQPDDLEPTPTKVIIRQGEEVKLFFHFGIVLSDNEVFVDQRLGLPGKYTIRMSFPDTGVVTNAVELEVAQPSGVNGVIWQRMRQITQGEGWSVIRWLNGELVGWILDTHPTSTYGLHLAGWRYALERKNDPSVLEWALNAGAAGPLRDIYRLTLADRYAHLSNDAALRGDFDGAITYAKREQRHVDELRKVSAGGYGTLATRRFNTITSRKEWEEGIKLAKGEIKPKKVIPIVECVTQIQGGGFAATFGYKNPNVGYVGESQIGDNHFSPAPVERGQPRAFRPGRQRNVFTVLHHGAALSWTVGSETVTASRDRPKKCKSDDDDGGDDDDGDDDDGDDDDGDDDDGDDDDGR